MDVQATAPNTDTSKTSKIKPLQLTVLVIVLILGAGAGVYYWQHTKVVASMKQVESQGKKLTLQEKQLTNQQNQITSLKKQIVSLTPTNPHLQLSYSGETHYSNYSGIGFDTNDLLIIDVSIKNTGPQPALFSRSNFVLKDKDNNSYPLAADSQLKSQPRFSNGIEGLPNDESEITDQSVPAGGVTNGVIVFYVPKIVNSFSLAYAGVVQQIAVN